MAGGSRMASMRASLYKYSTLLLRAASGFRFKDDDGLIGARHNGFGDGDEAVLLAEDAEARGLPIAGIEFRGGALRGARAAGVNLRDLHVEFRAVAHALLEDGENRYARQFGEQAFEGNDVTRQVSLSRGTL